MRNHPESLRKLCLATLLLMGVLADSFRSRADTFYVTVDLDSGPGSLRQAILDANANLGSDTIWSGVSLLQIEGDLPPLDDLTGGTIFEGLSHIQGGGSGTGLQVLSPNNELRYLSFDNFGVGLDISGSEAVGNFVEQCNFNSNGIAVQISNDACQNEIKTCRLLSSLEHAILIAKGSGNIIGASLTSLAQNGTTNENLISGAGNGITVLQGTGNQVAMNNFREVPADKLPIDLGGDGPTLNDENDNDAGPNNLLNYPMLFAAGYSPETIHEDGKLSGKIIGEPGATYFVHIFSVHTDSSFPSFFNAILHSPIKRLFWTLMEPADFLFTAMAGVKDLVAHFKATDLRLHGGDRDALLEARTRNGRILFGLDSVKVVP